MGVQLFDYIISFMRKEIALQSKNFRKPLLSTILTWSVNLHQDCENLTSTPVIANFEKFSSLILTYKYHLFFHMVDYAFEIYQIQMVAIQKCYLINLHKLFWMLKL